jgi:ParB family chromosome partitioning protein
MAITHVAVEIRKIRPNQRLVFSEESIEDLCRSILCHGRMEPLQVWFDGEGFRILDGEKRWRACKRLGMTRIEVLVVEPSRPLDLVEE